MLNFEEQKQRTLSGLMYNDLTSELVEARRVAVEPVSYTHLDVYKRQGYRRVPYFST